jgi:serine/threonine protein kinase
LIDLAHGSGLYPECLVQKDIQIVSEHPVAGGSFGDVYKGLMKGHLVAVKALRIFQDSDIVQLFKVSKCQIKSHFSIYPIWWPQEFSHEAVTWRQLSHPNLLPFYGIHHLNDNPSRLCLISPWMGNGRVTQFLKRFPTTDRVHLVSDQCRP